MRRMLVAVIAVLGLVSGPSLVSAEKVEVKRCPQYERLFKQHKMPVSTFSYLAWRESRCQNVIGWNYKKGYGWWSCKRAPAAQYRKCHAVASFDSGILQVNSSWTTLTHQICGGDWGDMSVLLKPKCNVAVAAYLYHEGGGLRNWGM